MLEEVLEEQETLLLLEGEVVVVIVDLDGLVKVDLSSLVEEVAVECIHHLHQPYQLHHQQLLVVPASSSSAT
jgi:hypothetical protein